MAAIQRRAIQPVRFRAKEQGNPSAGGALGKIARQSTDVAGHAAVRMVDGRRADYKMHVGQRVIQ